MSAPPEPNEWKFDEHDFYIYHIGLVAICTVMWGTMYQILRKYIFSNQSAEFSLRALSGIHGLTDIAWCIALHSQYQDNVEEPYRYEKFFIANAFGYIVLDFIWCAHHTQETLIQFLNHAILFATFGTYLIRDQERLLVITGYSIFESTDPVLQLRWFLKTHNKPYIAVEYLFILLFFATRLGATTYYGVKLLKENKLELIDKILMLLNYIMGVIFVINIVRYLIIKHYTKEEPRRSLRPPHMARVDILKLK